MLLYGLHQFKYEQSEKTEKMGNCVFVFVSL